MPLGGLVLLSDPVSGLQFTYCGRISNLTTEASRRPCSSIRSWASFSSTVSLLEKPSMMTQASPMLHSRWYTSEFSSSLARDITLSPKASRSCIQEIIKETTHETQKLLAATKAKYGKISKSYILTPPHPQVHGMSVKCEQPEDDKRTDGQTDGRMVWGGPFRLGGGGGA